MNRKLRRSPARARKSLALGLWALMVLIPGAAWADEPPTDPETDKAASEEAEPAKAEEKKPEVITNKDLEKYGKGDPRRNEWRPPAPDPPAPPAAATTEEPAPPEDRPGATDRLEMEARQAELEALLQFLSDKMAWMKNPFLPRPTPPSGESIVDPMRSASQQFADTRDRAEETRARLERVKQWLRDNPDAYGAPAEPTVP